MRPVQQVRCNGARWMEIVSKDVLARKKEPARASLDLFAYPRWGSPFPYYPRWKTLLVSLLARKFIRTNQACFQGGEPDVFENFFECGLSFNMVLRLLSLFIK